MVSTSLPKLRKTSDLGEAWATILIYAIPRWGKTRLLRSAEKPLVLATEMGAKRGLGTLQDLAIPFLEIDDMETLLQVARELGKNREVCEYDGQEFRHVFLDSASVAGELGLEGAKKTFGFGQFMWDATPGSGKDPRRAYPYMNEKMRQLMKLLFNIPAHFIAIAREAIAEESDGGTPPKTIQYKVPEFPGTKLPHELPGWPDATLRGDIVNTQRVLRTKTHMRAVAGVRAPDSIVVPEFILPNTTKICRWMQTWDPEILKQITPGEKVKPPTPSKAAPVATPVTR